VCSRKHCGSGCGLWLGDNKQKSSL